MAWLLVISVSRGQYGATRPQAAHHSAGMVSITASHTWILNSSKPFGELGLSWEVVNNRYQGLPGNPLLESVISIYIQAFSSPSPLETWVRI